ncbi:S41 family peptidase [Qipengyuania sediminis]|uniref:S41 family peptidase n=1 Tax=Qipengyuania sediminis TaxID=1532023 RepID=UPI00105A5989|nr:S41 family peptidase [Qipengyuania sediminis]
MNMGRTILPSIVALSLAACGGGGGSGGGSTPGPGTGVTPTPTPPPTTGTCSYSSRAQFVRDTLNEWYLFPELLDLTVNPASFTDVQTYIDALVAPARAQARDRYFTYITSIAEENRLIQTGSNAGFGIRLSYDTAANRVYVLEAFEGAPGFAAGIDRGTEILSINGTSVASLMASGGANAVSDALGPTQAGVTRTLTFRPLGGTDQTREITKTEFSLDPVSDRYGVKLLADGAGGQVGYINLRTFIVQDAGPQLRAAVAQFKAAGVNRVILDFRYNGGGLVSVAKLLGDLLAADKTGQVFSRTVLRPSKSSENETDLFAAQPEAIAATRIAVIGHSGTASASELVANAFIPYLGTGLALVGANTFGKPVGQFAFDRSACDDRLRAVTFRTVNRDGGGDYYTGLASVMPRTCAAGDDFLRPLGDAEEASTKTAVDFLAGRSCTPITAGGGVTAQGAGDRYRLLQSRAPTAAQRENPGLF